MKKAIVFLSGKLNIKASYYKNMKYEEYDIYCADGGANYAYNLEVVPKLILGDLDSVSEKVISYFEKLEVKIDKYPTSKDFTDGELILDEVSTNYEKVIVLGGLGGRTDHFLTNLNLLEKYKNIIFEDENEILFFVEKKMKIENQLGKTISFIPLTDIKSLSLTGFTYEVEKLNLSRASSRCMSNIIEKENVMIEYSEGSIIGIIQK